ncbi:MAG TPA: hypothetical protein VFF26_04945 [Gallionella sp.]|nr:hypothetical protein [Gallionella sp.]
MDLLVNPTPENSARINQAFKRLQLPIHTNQSFSKPGLQVPLKHTHYAELLTPRKDGPSYSSVARNAIRGKLFNIPVLIASPNSLIELKKLVVTSTEATKQKHLNDIECLRHYAV